MSAPLGGARDTVRLLRAGSKPPVLKTEVGTGSGRDAEHDQSQKNEQAKNDERSAEDFQDHTEILSVLGGKRWRFEHAVETPTIRRSHRLENALPVEEFVPT